MADRAPFIAHPPGEQDADSYRQFVELQTALGGLEGGVASLEAELGAVQARFGDYLPLTGGTVTGTVKVTNGAAFGNFYANDNGGVIHSRSLAGVNEYYGFSPRNDRNSVLRQGDGDARYARKENFGIDAEGLDLRSVNRIEFGGASLQDFMRWQTGQGLFGYENGQLQWILGTGNQRTRFETVYTQTTTAGANIHVGGNGDIVRSTSSGKFKKVRETVSDGLRVVMQLEPVVFTSLHDGDDPTIEHVGFIAEDVAAVLPAASEDEGQNYDVRAIVAALVGAVQELAERVAVLEGGGGDGKKAKP